MCDYSLHSVASRPAKVGDKLTTWDFGTGTIGFAAAENARVAVCVLPGTELAFSKPVECGPGDLMGWGRKTLNHRTAIFRQINKERALGASRRAGISGRKGCPPNQPVGRSGGGGASVAGAAYDRGQLEDHLREYTFHDRGRAGAGGNCGGSSIAAGSRPPPFGLFTWTLDGVSVGFSSRRDDPSNRAFSSIDNDR